MGAAELRGDNRWWCYGLRLDDDDYLVAGAAALKAKPVGAGGRAQPRVIRPGVLVVDRIYLLLRHGDAGASAERLHRDARGVDQLDEDGISGATDCHRRRAIDERLQIDDRRGELQPLDRDLPGAEVELVGCRQRLPGLNGERDVEDPVAIDDATGRRPAIQMRDGDAQV